MKPFSWACILLAGCASFDPHGREDYLRLYVQKEGTILDHEKDRDLELCSIRLENGVVRLRAENLESRWEVRAEGSCAAPDFGALVGTAVDVMIDVEFKAEDYVKPVRGQLKIYEVRGGRVKGALEGRGRDREVRADFQASTD